MAGTVAEASTSSVEASELPDDLACLRISPKQLERTAETLGPEIDAAGRSGTVFATEPLAALRIASPSEMGGRGPPSASVPKPKKYWIKIQSAPNLGSVLDSQQWPPYSP